MVLLNLWKESQLRRKWHDCVFYNDYRRLKKCFKSRGFVAGFLGLLPGHLWIDSVEIVVTTKCNLRCPACANLMQYYDKPYHLERDTVVASMRKLNECFDWCKGYRILGGEPFLNPDLKYFLEEIPREKCGEATVVTNATVIPDDIELLEVMRRKKIKVIISNYSCVQETQQLIALLKKENISFHVVKSDTWIKYGPLEKRNVNHTDLRRQFIRCAVPCKSVLNGVMYLCPRSGHGYDLGVIDRREGEYVELLKNTRTQNRRQIRRLMWRHEPVSACEYCLRGTDEAIAIPKGRIEL